MNEHTKITEFATTVKALAKTLEANPGYVQAIKTVERESVELQVSLSATGIVAIAYSDLFRTPTRTQALAWNEEAENLSAR